jgi:hypothetical protein
VKFVGLEALTLHAFGDSGIYGQWDLWTVGFMDSGIYGQWDLWTVGFMDSGPFV